MEAERLSEEEDLWRLSPPGAFFFLPFLFFFLLDSALKASAAFWSLMTKNSMSSRMWLRICCPGKKDFYCEKLEVSFL